MTKKVSGGAGSDHFKSATLNVKCLPKMSQAHVEHDVKRAAKSGADIIGWQEIEIPRYLQAIKKLDPTIKPGPIKGTLIGKHWSHYAPVGKNGKPNEEPISWKSSKFDLVNAGTTKLSQGLANVTPNRYATWVQLKDKATGTDVVRINTHLVSKAFDKGASHHAFRLHAYKEEIAKIKELAAHFQAKGIPVIIGGDFNHSHNKVLGNTVKYDNNIHKGTHGGATFDYLMNTPGSNANLLQAHGAHVDKHFYSDHDEVVAAYTLTANQIKA